MAILHQDDFESGAALSANYTGIIQTRTATGIGRSGGWGVESFGTSGDQYNGEFRRDVVTASRGGTASAWFDHAYAGNLSGGAFAIEVRSPYFGTQYIISLSHDVGTNQLSLTYRNEVDFPDYDSGPIGAYTPGTFTKLGLAWCLSTINEAFESNPDGHLQVLVDDVVVLDLPDIRVVSWVEDNSWDRVAFSPMGNLDDLLITDEGCILLTSLMTSTVFGINTTIAGASRAVAFGLDGATNVHTESGKAKVFGNCDVKGYLELQPMTAPGVGTGARLYLDTADGDLKVIFANSQVRTIDVN